MEVLKKLDKAYGEGIVRPFTEVDYPSVEVVSTGSLLLDRAISGPKANRMLGIPLGRITLIWGDKGCGKTTLIYHILAETQKLGKTAAIMSVEEFAPEYAMACGVDLDKLLFIQTYRQDTGEDLALEDLWTIVEALVRSGNVNLIAIDSLNRMTPRAELDGEIGESHPALQARANAQAIRKLSGVVFRHQVAIVGISQVNYKIGTMFGDPRTLSGGQALRHGTSLRINVQSRMSAKKEDGLAAIQSTICYIPLPWNKIAPPCGKTEIEIRFGEGIDKLKELVEIGADVGAYPKKGAYYYFTNSEKYDVQGEASARQFLAENPEVAAEIEEKIRAFYAEPVERETESSKSEEPEA